uniref:Octanoyltransferase n=1 Tax=uncultured Thiotrichaceae bacterium TaxID=298394 RepID=A0A6S6TM33_9GAMM|nr:MAG: Octanoate-[acyl-carrier-protein]-protein-N-octanoyltransferase [uncultured Thiotrichaceae bacterium]
MGVVNARVLGENLPYPEILQKMQDFTRLRTEETADEIWLLEHAPVFTLGRNGQMEHVLNPGDIPVIPIDRGGQVTYHGPGQLIVYLLLDVKRMDMGVRELVMNIEQSVIDLLAMHNIEAIGDRDAPGVYVEGKKISALGLRVSRGKTYHGLSLNVEMDLEPFQRINPCGYEGLEVTQCADLGVDEGVMEVAGALCNELARNLGYEQICWEM